MAGISKKRYKTKKGVVTKYVITYRDYEGNQHTAGCYDTEKEAKSHLEEYSEIKVTQSGNITFGELLDLFMQKVERKYAKNTIKAYESYINNYLYSIRNIKYNRLNSIMLQGLFDNLESAKPYTAHNVLVFCRGVVNYAIKKRIIRKYNVFEDIDDIKRPSRNLNHLELEDILKVLDTCKNAFPNYYSLVFLLLGSGLRIGEAIALEQKDYRDKSIIVNKQFTAGELKYKTKTDSSTRRVYLFDTLAAVLERHIEEHPGSKLLFPNLAGGYINPSNFRNRVWKPLLKQCGIDYRVRLHDTRGSYTDLTLSSGISGKFAQNQLGHEDCSVTYNIYAKNNQDSIRRALEILDEKFKKCEHNVSIENQESKTNVISIFSHRAKTGIKKEPSGS